MILGLVSFIPSTPFGLKVSLVGDTPPEIWFRKRGISCDAVAGEVREYLRYDAVCTNRESCVQE